MTTIAMSIYFKNLQKIFFGTNFADNIGTWYTASDTAELSSWLPACFVLHGPGHAKTCLMPNANNKGADQPAHPCSLISTFVRYLDSMICILAISTVSRF